MIQVDISAAVRAVSGKGYMRRLRMEGLTPAVVYGKGGEAQMLQMDTKTLSATLMEIVRRNAIVTLKIDEVGEKSVMVKELQTDPIRDTLIHADFCEIDLDKERQFKVPVKFKGTAKGVDLGGSLEVMATSVVLEAKPLDIPDEVTLDISGLNIGGQLKCSAIEVAENVKMVSNPDAACVGVTK